MLYDVVRLDAAYEVAFKQPELAIARDVASILIDLYNELSPRYAVTMADFRALPGTSMDDVGARVQAFSGRGVLTLRPTRLLIEFQALISASDLDTAKDFAMLAKQVIAQRFPSIQPAATSFRVRSWIKCEEGATAALKRVNEKASPKQLMSLANQNTDEARYALRAELSNSEDGWRTVTTVERSALSGADVHIGIDCVFLSTSKFAEYEEQVKFVDEYFSAVLAHFEFEPKGVSK